jgi:hypothetical protein
MKTDEGACFKDDGDNENKDELLCYGDSDYNNTLGILNVLSVEDLVTSIDGFGQG